MTGTEAATELMRGIQIRLLRFELLARESIGFGSQPGGQLRGAIYNALSDHYCSERGFERTPGHQERCPVCWLLATEDDKGERGHDLPRPLIMKPPVGISTVVAGANFVFELALVGQRSAECFPFLVRAVEAAGKNGVGYGRGRFTIKSIQSLTPISNQGLDLLVHGRVSALPISLDMAEIIENQANSLPTNRVTLRFITPLRVGENKHLAHKPDLGILVRRLVERCQAMAKHFGTDESATDREHWRDLYLRLSASADSAQLVHDNTRWVEIQSGSRRRGTSSPISGLVGEAEWKGELSDLRYWLLWGELLHVGKSTVKGNGWYQIVR